MKKHNLFHTMLLVLFTVICSHTTYSQESVPNPNLIEENLGGPRLGLTYIVGNSDLAKALKTKGIDPVISQFGWHFEYQVRPKTGGPAFLVEFIPMIAGVEYGTLIPSATLMLGLRLPNGIEFGMGPNVLIGGNNLFNTSLILAVGKTFDYGGVNIPINLALSTSPMGQRISFIFGYSIGE